ncbi:MAG TPA: hypothetical protein VF543_03040 [Pyrinomonadaceae bacterium]|jgi:hypothetical protein
MQQKGSITVQEFYEQQYRARRYLEHASDKELEQRLRDIMANMTGLNEAGQLTFLVGERQFDHLNMLFTHVLTEHQMRGRGFSPGLMMDVMLPNATAPDIPKSVLATRGRTLPKVGTYLVKLGKEEHIREALEEGKFLINPASTYGDPSLNQAIRDVELELEVQAHPSDVKMEVYDGSSGALKAPIQPVGNVTYTLRSRTNYYVYCMSAVYDYRLFDDFGYNSCLIIKNPQEFIKRLIAGFKTVLPDWNGFAVPVTYYDPYNTTVSELNVFFCKHFRFAYQKEVRVIWLPPAPVASLSPVKLQLGSLKDCCEMVTL